MNRDDLASKLAALDEWMRLPFNREDFSYQSCRFCKKTVSQLGALWKYGVRHYVCDECRDHIIVDSLKGDT